ncbi:COMM domain-containing protein 3 [Hyalella azteca]|uniref:COMM domain-containing protein 3 n=1 Tax=Hyalella azteca TaxID=294128 RepID=A0A8B7P4N6_HYAAZ|nr:COMM domain-containing protein 3 [Hyalella azteca]
MELSFEVCNALKALSSSPKAEFEAVVVQATEDLIEISQEEKIVTCQSKVCCSSSSSYSSLLTLFTELSKHQLSSQHLTEQLQDLDWPQDRIASVCTAYESVTSSVRCCLSSVASLLPHIVDVDWKLVHTVSSTSNAAEKESVYLLRFTVRPSNMASNGTGCSTNEAGSAASGSKPNLEYITLRCSLPELVAVTDSLRRAVATLNKLAGAN